MEKANMLPRAVLEKNIFRALNDSYKKKGESKIGPKSNDGYKCLNINKKPNIF